MKKGFTLIELSIVLIVVGLLMGGAFQMMKVMGEKARATEAKNTLEATKEAVIAFAINNNRLPTAAEFAAMNFRASGNIPLYYNFDNALTLAAQGPCGITTTPLNTTDVNGVNTQNVAFVLAVAGENLLIQTTRVGNLITFPQWNTLVGGRGYDDFHIQVTLGELQSTIGCQPPRIINPSIYTGSVGTNYNVSFAGEGGNGNYTFARTAGAFPPGAPAFNLTAAGVLTGTPTTPGSSIFTLQITSNGVSTTRQYVLVVN